MSLHTLGAIPDKGILQKFEKRSQKVADVAVWIHAVGAGRKALMSAHRGGTYMGTVTSITKRMMRNDTIYRCAEVLLKIFQIHTDT